jgi:hypothetical protein
MKPSIILILLFAFVQSSFAQKKTVDDFAAIDKKALQLPDSQAKSTDEIADYIKANFQTDKDKSRAIFIWIASNIKYDIENMFAINFYENELDKISKPLQTRKGICENYAALFKDLCTKSGLKSYVIEGYTKQNGFSDYLSHAWCAARIDGAWYLFDPTWGAGYVNNGKFFSKINNGYYMVKPSVLIDSHMPFDYLWQFLNYPITNQEFIEGKKKLNKSKSFFNFNDSIQAYEGQDRISKLITSASRIEKNGVKNSLIFDRLQHIKLEIENDRQNRMVDLYNSASADYNDGINRYNDFIYYRNKQFLPKKTDLEIQNMIDLANDKLKESKSKLAQINSTDLNMTNMMMQLLKSVDDVANHVKEQQEWLTVYFSKGKLGRKAMFIDKVTWFGIPLN